MGWYVRLAAKELYMHHLTKRIIQTTASVTLDKTIDSSMGLPF